MKTCPHGHAMTPENTRVRFTRTSLYAFRECLTCIRERRQKRRPTEAQRAANRAYARAKREGTWVPQRLPITAEERTALEARHEQRIAEVGSDWARKRKSKAVRLRAVRVERERQIAEVIAYERKVQLQAVTDQPELAALIAEQTRDARTFNLPRTPRFVPQDWAERLFYGEPSYEEWA